MSLSGDEILIQRQLRAAEIALETARRRRFETDETVRALQGEIADVEAALSVMIAAREEDRVVADARVAAAHAAQREAEQVMLDERARRRELEQELDALARELTARDALRAELAAETRIRQLEGELELVQRRAAEVEHGLRVAVLDALAVLGELSAQVGAALAGRPSLASQGPDRRSFAADGAPVGRAGAGVDSGRLDAALERLRAQVPAPDGPT